MLAPNFEKTLQRALNYAKERCCEYATLEFLLLALTEDSDAEPLFNETNISIDRLRRDLIEFLSAEQSRQTAIWQQDPKPTVGLQRVLHHAKADEQASGGGQVTGRSVLKALLAEPESHAVFLLRRQTMTQLDEVNLPASDPARTEDDLAPGRGEGPRRPATFAPQAPEALSNYCTDLNRKAREGKIDPLIGRGEEIERTVQILCRRTKNNPLYVGDPGVGKTAIAEGLARQIVAGDIPRALEGAVIYALDMTALLAGTRYRGEFEERLKEVVNSLQELPGAVLFIDEIHTLVGAGATSDGAMDASNLLKPALQSGALRCIGSTTYKEFRKHFEKDSALVRRFQKIDIAEPSTETTVEILHGLRSCYEEHHGVRYTDDALRTAVEMSARFITGRKLPDKAIDVIDEAGARHKAKDERKANKTIRVEDIEMVVSKIARIPPKSVSNDDRQALANLERDLAAKVYGQDRAIQTVTSAIKLARAGLRDARRPIGCYLFSGPTGVGKTEVARQLAESLGIRLNRFDMSEYMEPHSVSRLIGAPPGYIGFDQGGLLTDAIDQHPHCVLLLDEIEKAHPDLFNILLQVMDDGRLTDHNGKTCDFRNVILIMTTNAGAAAMARPAVGFGRETRSGEDEDAMNKLFAPEFRNRLDAIVGFDKLGSAVMSRIVDKFIAELAAQLAERGVSLELSEPSRKWLAQKGHDPLYGARPLARVIQETVKRPLAEELLFGKLKDGGHVVITRGDPLDFAFRSTPDRRRGSSTVRPKGRALAC